MTLGVIGTIIGLLVAAIGIYYFIKEKQDAESRKIYGTASIAGVLILIFFYYKAAAFIRQVKTKSGHEKRKMVSSSFFRMILMRGSIYEELNRND